MADKKSILDQKVAILKGIAHPVRLAVVEALADSEMCVCDIAEMFHYDRTTISKHLALMKNLGILEDRKEGLKVYYSLRIRCLPSMLSCIEKVVEGNDPERVFVMGCCGK